MFGLAYTRKVPLNDPCAWQHDFLEGCLYTFWCEPRVPIPLTPVWWPVVPWLQHNLQEMLVALQCPQHDLVGIGGKNLRQIFVYISLFHLATLFSGPLAKDLACHNPLNRQRSSSMINLFTSLSKCLKPAQNYLKIRPALRRQIGKESSGRRGGLKQTNYSLKNVAKGGLGSGLEGI